MPAHMSTSTDPSRTPVIAGIGLSDYPKAPHLDSVGHNVLAMQRALDEVHPGEGVLFGRPGWTGQQAVGVTWGGDQPSDFWSLRTLVGATLTAAASGFMTLRRRGLRAGSPARLSRVEA